MNTVKEHSAQPLMTSTRDQNSNGSRWVCCRRDDPLAAALRGVLRGPGPRPARAAVRGQQAAGPRAADAAAAAAQRRPGAARAHGLPGAPPAQGEVSSEYHHRFSRKTSATEHRPGPFGG